MPPKPRSEPPDFVRKLQGVLPIEWRSMFGGVGIYSEGIFFALVSSQGVPYLRVGEANRADFEKAGSGPFMPYSRGKSRADTRVTMPYYEVPEKVLGRPATLRKWASRSLEAARAAKAACKGKSPTKSTRSPSGLAAKRPPPGFI